VPLPPGVTSPPAAAHQLRARALHAVVNCHGVRPAWFRAVRTTFSKAMKVVGRGNDDIAIKAADPVYLALMKGDFTFRGPAHLPSACDLGPTQHYYSAVYDAATFVLLEAGLGNRPLPVPLQALGPVLNGR
jgi:hypothetical protein